MLITLRGICIVCIVLVGCIKPKSANHSEEPDQEQSIALSEQRRNFSLFKNWSEDDELYFDEDHYNRNITQTTGVAEELSLTERTVEPNFSSFSFQERMDYPDKMKALGGEILRVLVAEPEILDVYDPKEMLALLQSKMDPPFEGSLFEGFLKDGILPTETGSKINLNSPSYRHLDMMTAVISLLWFSRGQLPEAESRGAWSFGGKHSEMMQRMFLRYGAETNQVLRGYSFGSAGTPHELAVELASQMKKSGEKNALFYDRNAIEFRNKKIVDQSSHIKQQGLKSIQFGFDPRISAKKSSLSGVLPHDGSDFMPHHTLLGFFKDPKDRNVLFYKFERLGFGDALETLGHLFNWREHSKSGKAGAGFRESRMLEVAKKNVPELEKLLNITDSVNKEGKPRFGLGHRISRIQAKIEEIPDTDQMLRIDANRYLDEIKDAILKYLKTHHPGESLNPEDIFARIGSEHVISDFKETKKWRKTFEQINPKWRRSDPNLRPVNPQKRDMQLDMIDSPAEGKKMQKTMSDFILRPPK